MNRYHMSILVALGSLITCPACIASDGKSTTHRDGQDVTLEQLTGAIRAVAAGGTLYSPAVTERVLRGLARAPTSFEAAALPEPLTRREREVLRLMAAGASNKEIARALRAADGTIKNHASAIFAKLGVRDRTRAVLRALELGIL